VTHKEAAITGVRIVISFHNPTAMAGKKTRPHAQQCPPDPGMKWSIDIQNPSFSFTSRLLAGFLTYLINKPLSLPLIFDKQ
jgi:hypothetical protein